MYIVDIYMDGIVILTETVEAIDAYDAEEQMITKHNADDAIAWYIDNKEG